VGGEDLEGLSAALSQSDVNKVDCLLGYDEEEEDVDERKTAIN